MTDLKSLTQLERDAAEHVAEKLNDAFFWGDAPEGELYWNEVYDRLMAISRGISYETYISSTAGETAN